MVVTVDSKRWEQVDNLFQAALELPTEERNAFIKKACADDAERPRALGDQALRPARDRQGRHRRPAGGG